MSIRGVNGKDLDVSSEVVRVNTFYGNGTGRKSIRPSQPKDYGAKRSVAAGRRYRPVGREAFRQVAPMRKSEPSYEAYNPFRGMEGAGMRGRVKAYYKDVGGGGQPDADMGEVTGIGAVQEGSEQYYNAPMDYDRGLSSYVETRGEEPGPYVPYEQVADYVETRGEESGYYEPYAVGDMGQAYTGPQVSWRHALSDFSKDIIGFNWFTTASQELRAYNKGMHVVATGRAAFAGQPHVQAGVNAIAGELARWKDHRTWAITKVPGSVNRVSISKVRTRMINALNYARVAVNLASLSGTPTVPTFPIPTSVKEEAPGAATPPGVVPMVIEEPLTWFEKNKTMVIGGAVVAALGLGYYLYKKG